MTYRIRLFGILAVLALIIAPLASALASDLSAQNYKKAFKELDLGHTENAMAFVVHGRDPILNKVILSSYMATPGNTNRFEEMAVFVGENPEWPGLNGILAIAEQKIPSYFTSMQVINWFIAHPPQSLPGVYRYADALSAEGKTDALVRLVRGRWTEGSLSPDDLVVFATRYSSLLNRDVNWARLDRLLWKNDIANVRLMYRYITPDQKALAEARLNLAQHPHNIDAILKRAPPAWQKDPGFKMEILRADIANKSDEKALSILFDNPESLGHSDAWWDLRQVVARRLMERHDYARAYRLIDVHGVLTDKNKMQAEFLAGWIALRFLNQPEDAEKHFEKFCDIASTPVSRARGSYWLGRTYEVLDDKDAAEQSYQDAAVLNTTYYGQLAALRLSPNPVLQIRAEPVVPKLTRDEFYGRNIVIASDHLIALGEIERSHTFFKAALENASQRFEFVLLSELAYKWKRLDWAIETAKTANQKNLLLAASGFPLLPHQLPTPPEPAFTYALIRQESQFNTNAASPAGAVGLMQLMPKTAKGMAREIGVHFNKSQLDNPDYNLRLGRAYILSLLNHYNGSYVLTLAAYNAGPVHVTNWIGEFGDPRNSNVDPIDWVELIPVSETRNYVQRILESIQTYRAEENNGEAPLLILKDLRR